MGNFPQVTALREGSIGLREEAGQAGCRVCEPQHCSVPGGVEDTGL